MLSKHAQNVPFSRY